MTSEVSQDDLFGIFYVMKPNGAKWDSYYKTIDALRPLFKKEKFREIISGFYLNVAGDNFNAVRISYFVDEKDSMSAIKLFKGFFRNNGIIEIQNMEPPHKIVIAQSYGGITYEERFRNYLANETQIGLELLQGNPLHAKRLFTTFRWQIRKANLSFEKHFEPTFERYSMTYNSWTKEKKLQFFRDLKEWPVRNQVDWAHLMVNMILGADWNGQIISRYYLTPGKPASISEINQILTKNSMGFQIPLNWKPISFNAV